MLIQSKSGQSPRDEVSRYMMALGQDLAPVMLHSGESSLTWGVVGGARCLLPASEGETVLVSAPGESVDASINVGRDIAGLIVSIHVLDYVFMSMWGERTPVSKQVLERKYCHIEALRALAPPEQAKEILALVA